MITAAVREVLRAHGEGLNRHICVEVFVPQGEKLAEKTLNARLGILGGISILGTTGIVRPLSHDAYIATIKASIDVAGAGGTTDLFFTTGRRSERFAMGFFPNAPEENFIQTGDFFKAALDAARENGNIQGITYVVFFGKAVKMALGFPHTHAAKSELTLKQLSQWSLDITGDETLYQAVARANTARHAFTHIHPHHPELMTHVGRQVVAQAKGYAGPDIQIQAVILDFEGNIAFDSRIPS